MSRILIRFNNKFEDDDKKRKWRILIDGTEFLAHKVKINTLSETIQEDIEIGITKYHILCYGDVMWDSKDNASIY